MLTVIYINIFQSKSVENDSDDSIQIKGKDKPIYPKQYKIQIVNYGHIGSE